MKILILHNKYQLAGGEDTVVLNEQTLLEKHGHLIKVVYFDNNDISGIFKKLQTAVHAVYNTKAKNELENSILEFRPDVIHVHNFFPKISPSIFFLANELNIPIVQTIHNYRFICPGALLMREEKVCEECVSKSFTYPAITNKCYRGSALQSSVVATVNFVHNQLGTWKNKVDGFIFLTDFAKQKFIGSSLKLKQENLFIKPNFVEDKGFNTKRGKHFLFVGRISTEKGTERLLKVFTQSNHKITIIGNGPLEELVKEASATHSNIIFLGKQPAEIVIEKMKQCRALVFPSIWYEGMPMTILEAFSTGCPVIASNLGAMQSLIKDSYNGLHFKAGDENDLLQKLDLVTEDMFINARQTYLNEFTPEQNYRQLMDIYQKVIDAKATHH